MIAKDSLKKRYLSKLGTNFVGLFFGLAIAMVVPRALGPKDYGDFEFITSFFRELIPFFTFATSMAFFSKISQRQSETSLIVFYKYVLWLGFSLLIFFVILSQNIGFDQIIWPDQKKIYVMLGLGLVIITTYSGVLGQILDALGVTVKMEIGKIIQKIIGLSIISVLFFFKLLNLTSLYIYNIVIQLILFVIFLLLIKNTSAGINIISDWYLPVNKFKKYIVEFYRYSQPLFVYGLIGAFVGIFDRWILQIYGGSIEQGFFGLAFKIGTLCFIFTSAMTTLIIREMSIAYHENNFKKMRYLFRRYVPILYSIAAILCCFIFMNAEAVGIIIGGADFKEARITIMIMSLYPIHQTYGQLCGSIFYATGQTRLYRNIGIIFMIIGALAALILIAPKNQYGFEYGSIGLALKFLLIQYLLVNVQLYYNSKLLELNFKKYFIHQLACLGMLLIFSFISKIIADYFFSSYYNIYFSVIFPGIIYSLIVLIVLKFFPIIFGLYREDLRQSIAWIKNILLPNQK
jgi:O-antigen/teichoic acid export membrane protein